MRIIGNDPKSQNGEVRAVASGALTDGSTVVVNSDGTVGVVGITAQSLGSIVEFEDGGAHYIAAVYDTNSDKVVVAYSDQNNSDYGTALVGTVSGASISFGSAVVFETQAILYLDMAFDSGSSKVILGYSQGGNSDQGVGIVGTVNGTSISFGSATNFGSFTDSVNNQIGVAYDSNANRAVFAYRLGGSGNRGDAVVGTVSSTSISMGTPATFNSGVTSDISADYDASSQKVVISYRDIGNSSYGTAVVATVSGTSISFGSETVFETSATQYTQTVHDSVNNTVIIAYMDGGDSDKGKATIGTVSSTSISFSTPVTFYDTAGISSLSASFDAGNSTVVLSFRGTSAYGIVLAGTTTASSFSFGDPLTITTSAYDSIHSSSTYDPDSEQVVLFYADQDDGDDGKAVLYTSSSTNLTSENFIGISNGAYADGDSARIQTGCSVNDAQSGLTAGQAYYVQTDGTLSETPDDPSVLAGTALSATKLLIKG